MSLTQRQIENCLYAQVGAFIPEPDSICVDREGWHQIITPSIPSVVMNEVYVSMIPDAAVERVVAETIAEYRRQGLPFKWIVGPMSSPARLRDVLAPLAAQQWWFKGMVAPASLAIECDPSITVEVMTAANSRDYFDATSEGWGFDEKERAQLSRKIEFVLAHADTYRYFIARLEGCAVGTAGLVLRPDYGYLIGANTVASARGRGVYKSLIEARHALLRSVGREYSVTQARGATSAPILERMGFETAYDAEVYLIRPDGPRIGD